MCTLLGAAALAAAALLGAALWRLRRLAAENAELRRRNEEFFAAVSHDAGNPLAAALGFAALIKERAADPDEKRAAEGLSSALEGLDDLVSDLAEYSGALSGPLTLEKESVAMRPLIEGTIARLERLAKTRQVRLEASLEGELASVQGDAKRLAQALRQLLVNAIDYSGAGKSVRVRARAADGALTVLVEDGGFGIRPEHHERVFEGGFRAPEARASRGARLGVGLRIARRIAEAHGGSLTLESRPGAGSSFRLSLPV